MCYSASCSCNKISERNQLKEKQVIRNFRFLNRKVPNSQTFRWRIKIGHTAFSSPFKGLHLFPLPLESELTLTYFDQQCVAEIMSYPIHQEVLRCSDS